MSIEVYSAVLIESSDQLMVGTMALDFPHRVRIERVAVLTARTTISRVSTLAFRSFFDMSPVLDALVTSEEKRTGVALELARSIYVMLARIATGAHYEYWHLVEEQPGRRLAAQMLGRQLSLYVRCTLALPCFQTGY